MPDRKVLIVDDDKEWSLLLKLRLEAAGYKVEQAYNGREGLDKIGVNRPDLLLLDITMPVLSGWDVCVALRADPATADLPILILSSFSQPDDIERGKSYRAKRYIIKPCSPAAVLQNIQDVFDSKKTTP